MTKVPYSIRYANIKDVDIIMNFIKKYWAAKHILANNKEFFLYEFLNHPEQLNFVIAEDCNEDILAILGFIEYGKEQQNIMTVVWKSISKEQPFLGVELLKYLTENKLYNSVSSVGINKKTVGIYNYLGYTTGKLDHYYRLADIEEYNIAQIQDKQISPSSSAKAKEYELVELGDFEDFSAQFNWQLYTESKPNPYKELWYIEKRYYNHPIYKYKMFGIKNLSSNLINSVIVCREIVNETNKILRIVDFLGDGLDMQYISYEMDQLIKKENYEYIDFYQYGIDETILNKAGFLKKIGDNNIIPNYFEPYDLKNIEIQFFTTKPEGIRLFKADCDQDRPNYF